MIDLIIQYPIVSALIALAGMSITIGAILGFASVRYKIEGNPLVDEVDSLLPQTQCGQCGYPGCRPYAEAIVDGDQINKCPPGGQQTINDLANLLDVEAPTLDEDHGEESDVAKVAFIREEDCIGCTKCIQACPVDAILGSSKHTHTVITSECTGCDLCVEPCPTDCIDLIPIEKGLKDWAWEMPEPAKAVNIIATDRRPHREDAA